MELEIFDKGAQTIKGLDILQEVKIVTGRMFKAKFIISFQNYWWVFQHQPSGGESISYKSVKLPSPPYSNFVWKGLNKHPAK